MVGPVHLSPRMRAAQPSAVSGKSPPDASSTTFCSEARP
jgi:hypothetical protein